MSDPTASHSDAFLAGQGIPVAIGRVEAELTSLWGPAADRIGGPERENPHLTRLVLANLIIRADPDQAVRVAAALDAVVARYPSRAIVLGRPEAGGTSVEAEVAAVCHLPSPGLPQVCSERIVLRAGPETTGLLPGAVLPLLETDLPVVLWWAGDPRYDPELFKTLARDATRLILDLPLNGGVDPGALAFGLDPEGNPHARDSSWFGIVPWRELIAQFFDGPTGLESIGRVRSVEVEATVPLGPGRSIGPGPSLDSAWLVAWLAGQLGWEWASGPERTGDTIAATFRAGPATVSAMIRSVGDPSSETPALRSVAIVLDPSDGPCSFRLERPAGRPGDLRVEVCSGRTSALPRVVVAPELDTARRINAGLESSRVDPPFDRARPHLLRLLGGSITSR